MLLRALKNLNNLIYPPLCAACAQVLLPEEPTLCTHCLINLPYSGFERMPDNPVMRLFRGRLVLVRATSLLLYGKGGSVAHLMHGIKYKGNRLAGYELGQLMGSKIADAKDWEMPDLIVPIPLSKWRLQRRGYNQAALLASGLADITGIPLMESNMSKSGFGPSQTGLGRFIRWKNVENVFKVRNPELFANKHIPQVQR